MKHFSIAVYGTVQGVGFRWATRARARLLGVSGFVRNEIDGSVYIEAEGAAAGIDQFIAWCRKGPPGAIVDRAEVSEGDVKGFKDFEIRL